ncbi:MAG: sodium-translocating pyrophosphatase [Lentisphaeria bacterium]|nr:sodium-translocating pyrophosphatase [Lentisphaeria bacterium]
MAQPFPGTISCWWFAPVCALIALLTALVCYRLMIRAPKGNSKMEEIAGFVKQGAMIYLRQQYSRVGSVFVVIFVVLVGLARLRVQNPFVPVAFLTGGFFSGLCGFLGMKTATAASSRTAQGASESLNRGLQVAFRSGAVTGLVVVGFGLLDITAWYYVLDQLVYTPEHLANGFTLWGIPLIEAGTVTPDHRLIEITTTMLTFGMGASTQALFARVGGGIYTKAADIGADLVGKVEEGIPEDDPRNPAVIADNVGDNVGNVAGMGADLYESYCGSILATAALGAALPVTYQETVLRVNAPMIVAGLGILLSIVGIFTVRCKEGSNMGVLLRTLRTGILGSFILILIVCAGLAGVHIITWGIFGAIVSGLVAGVVIGYSTEYYTSDGHKPTQELASQSQIGPATTIIDGLSLGMLSSGIPVIVTAVAILCAFAFAGGFTKGMICGLYGIGFAAVGMLSTLAITLATEAYGPIADNAGGIAEMSHLPPHVRERTDALDMLGNTTAATGKGFAIASAALTATALLAAVIQEVEVWTVKLGPVSTATGELLAKLNDKAVDHIRAVIDHYDISIMNPLVLCGMFIGAMMAFVFCALTMKAVGRAAGRIVEEVHRQFLLPGIRAGDSRPDYARCVEISILNAQHEMMLPSLLAIIVPILTGLILGVAGIMGLLAGGLTAGFALAFTLNNAGCAWDNAKKHIEKGNYGGKKLADGSRNPTLGAAVIGDTVGDPCKDTSGPSLNILLKLMSMVAVVFTPVFVKFSPLIRDWLGKIAGN